LPGQWPDDGQDVIVARRFDGKDWSGEWVVSGTAGVNHKPVVVPEGDSVRVLWTALRNGGWAAYQRRWSEGKWSAEERIPNSENSLEVRAKPLAGGGILAVISRLAAPRIELDARVWRDSHWSSPVRLDESRGRCHRASLLPLADGRWVVAWDEEREGHYAIFARWSDRPLEHVTDSELWDTSPSLARTPEGRIWVAWERKETIGGRFAYQGRSIYGKFFDGARWQWAASPFAAADPGRLTRHSRFWAMQGISEERYPQMVSFANGDLWLFWVGGGRSPNPTLSGRVWKQGRWSEPRLIIYNPLPSSGLDVPTSTAGDDFRSRASAAYQAPLLAEVALTPGAPGELWLAYELPASRRVPVRDPSQFNEPPAAYGADIYTHKVDLAEREFRLPRVVDDNSPIAPLQPRSFRKSPAYSVNIGGQTYRLVFGDLHGHTENDAIGTVDMYYAHGLFVTGMDFIASTNHDYSPDFISASEWAATQALASVYNRIPGHVAFSGYEWTTAPVDARGGHRAMYFLADNGPLHRSTTVATNTVQKLFEHLRGIDVILQPHHKGWEGYDPKLQPVVEITSAWREQREEGSEFKPQGKVSSAWEALERGYRIGFVGSGDTHWLGPGEDYGITGAYVKELSREAVFEAIRSRRVFASTGARMLLDFRVNGTFMGGETGAGDMPRIAVSVTGDADLEQVEIVRDHRVVYAAPCSGRSASIQFIDRAGKPQDRRSSYYYARVTQRDGMRAWSSPMWVDWR